MVALALLCTLENVLSIALYDEICFGFVTGNDKNPQLDSLELSRMNQSTILDPEFH